MTPDTKSDTKSTTWSPPTLTIEPMTPMAWNEHKASPRCGHCDPHRVLIVLDTWTGRLSARRARHGQEADRHEWTDGHVSLQPWGLRYATRHIAIAIDHWQAQTPDDVNTIMGKVAHPARHLLQHLVPVPGSPGEWDWTLDAARGYSAMRAIALNPHLHAEGEEDLARYGEGYVTIDQVIARWPDWPQDDWAGMTDRELDELAASPQLHIPSTPYAERAEHEKYWGWSWPQ